MAETQNPIIGRARNKMGGTIFQKWKGRNVIRSAPLSVKNPQTEKQEANRIKMRIIMLFWKWWKNIIRIGFTEYEKKRSAYNSYISYNLKNSFLIINDRYIPNLEEWQLSQGSLKPIEVESIELSDTRDEITITIEDYNPIYGSEKDDYLMIALWHQDTDTTTEIMTANKRNEKIKTIEVNPEEFQAQYYHAFFVTTSKNKDKASKTKYMFFDKF